MEKINFNDLPNTNTPINSSNLNQLQTNVENAINGVVTSGSNSIGKWVKLPDGTLIQRGKANCGTTGFASLTFPISFIDEDISMTADNAYGSEELGVVLTTQTTKTTGVIYFRKYISGNLAIVTDTTVEAHWIAIGRWK